MWQVDRIRERRARRRAGRQGEFSFAGPCTARTCIALRIAAGLAAHVVGAWHAVGLPAARRACASVRRRPWMSRALEQPARQRRLGVETVEQEIAEAVDDGLAAVVSGALASHAGGCRPPWPRRRRACARANTRVGARSAGLPSSLPTPVHRNGITDVGAFSRASRMSRSTCSSSPLQRDAGPRCRLASNERGLNST